MSGPLCLACGVPLEEGYDDKSGRLRWEAASLQPGYEPQRCPKGGGHKVRQVVPDPPKERP